MSKTNPKQRIFVLTSKVYEMAGGRTKATIERMKFLQQHFDATLIEMSASRYPGQELPAVFAKYKTTFNAINPWLSQVKDARRVKNYVDMLRDRTGGLADARILEGAQESFVSPTLSGGKIKSYMENGRIMRLREYHSDGRVELYTLDDKQNIYMRELYAHDELRSRYYLNVSGKVSGGFAVADNGTKRYVYRTQNDELVYSEDIAGHQAAFLNDVLHDGDVIISDVRYYDAVLGGLRPEIRKIHVWHEIAVDGVGNADVNPAYQTITNPDYLLSDMDRVVVFTDDAKAEYKSYFPQLASKLTVIPYGTDLKVQRDNVERDEDIVLSIGRLEAKQKDVAAQIRAFAIYNRKYPTSQLRIVGEGSDREKLETLVDELGIRACVEFCGFSHDVDGEFQKAGMMIFSSRYETFGLTILESLSNGTPVASYDVRFGAKSMIKPGKNGMLADANTPESLAKVMVKLRKAQLSAKQVQKTVARTFSRETFEKNWLKLLAEKPKKARHNNA